VDIFKKLKYGDIPKTGGPKEKETKNDIENRELFEYAKQENMDFNEINKAIYNQRNGNGKIIHNKEENDKCLKQIVNYEEKDNNNKSYNEKLFDKRNENIPSENFDNEIEEFHVKDINNDNIKKNNKIVIIDHVKKYEKASNNKNIENYELIKKTSEINFQKSKIDNQCSPKKKDFEKDIQNQNQIHSINNPDKIFLNKHQNSLKTQKNNYEFLDEIVGSKFKQKRINSITNSDIDKNNYIKEGDFINKTNNKHDRKEIHITHSSKEVRSQFNKYHDNCNFESEYQIYDKNSKQEANKENKKVDDSKINIDKMRTNLLTEKENLKDINSSLFIANDINKNLNKNNINSSISSQFYNDQSSLKSNAVNYKNLNYPNNASPSKIVNNQIIVDHQNKLQESFKLNVLQNQEQSSQPKDNAYAQIPCVLGTGYKFSYDKHIGFLNKNNQINEKISHTKKDKVNEIDLMLNNLKGNITNVKNKNVINLISKNKIIDNMEKEKSSINENRKYSLQNNPHPVQENINIDLINKASNDTSNTNKNKSYSNLETQMLKDFNLGSYKNLPSIEIPLDYNSPEKKSNIKRFFMNTAKESLQDIKKDEIQSSIKKLELLLFYFTNMKDD